MLVLTMIEGPTVYLKPDAIDMIAPEHAQPPAGIPVRMQIGKVIGSKVVLRSGVGVIVKELPDRVATWIERAEGAIRAGVAELEA